MDNSPISVVLLVAGDANAYAGLRQNLAERKLEARVVSTAAQCSAFTQSRSSCWRGILAGRRFARSFVEPYPTLIHAIGLETADLAMELSLRWKCPYVLTIEEFLRAGERIRLARSWCRGIVVPNRDFAADLIQGVGFPSRLVTVIPPGVWPAPMPVSSLEYRWIPVVGTAVGSDYGSGLPTFLDAAKIILDSGVEAEFVLAELGTGTALARRLADGLAMAERLTITEGIALERSFWPVIDLYAHTSRLPSSGRPLLAAMAHGIPSIASDVAGLRSIAGDGRPARIVPAGDAQALAHEILELLSERETALELGLRGRARIVSEYSPEREADALAALYREAIGSSEGVGVRRRSDAATSAVARRRS